MLRLVGLIAIFALVIYHRGSSLAVVVSHVLHIDDRWGWFLLVYGGLAAVIFIIARYFYSQAEEREERERMQRKAQGQWPKQPERQDEIL